MATIESETIDVHGELIKKAERLIRTALQSITDLQDVVNELNGKKTPRIREKDENDEPIWVYAIKRPVPNDIYCTKKFISYAADWGFTAEQAEILMNGAAPDSGSTYEGFKKYYQRMLGQPNGKWQNWTLVWQKWIREQNERKKNQDAGRGTKFDRQRTRV